MRDFPTKQLDPKIKNVWRISDTIWITIFFLIAFLPFFIAWLVSGATWALITSLVILAVFIVLIVIFVVVLPPIRYMRWRYELLDDYLDIARGIVWKKHIIIPFIRVQNTDTRQGPILRAFGLSSVTVSTAAGEHAIPGLGTQMADEVRDRAAELARVAQEDV